MELTKSQQIRIGLFLIVGIFVMGSSILMLGGDRLFLKKQALLHAYFDQVQGLNRGSVVSLSGLVIGNVKEIKFAADRSQLDVVLKIDEEHLDRLTSNSQVEIRTQGALGDKFIFIHPGDPSAEKLKDGDSLLVTKGSDFMAMLSEKGKDAEKVFLILNEVHKLLVSINAQDRSEKIMKNFAEASESFKSFSQESNKLVTEFRQNNSGKLQNSFDRLDKILTKIEKGEGSLGALINDPSIHEQLKAILGTPTRKKFLNSILNTSFDKEPTKGEK